MMSMLQSEELEEEAILAVLVVAKRLKLAHEVKRWCKRARLGVA